MRPLSWRGLSGLLCLLVLISPAVASGQSFQIQAAAGPTVTDQGFSAAAGIGFSPASRLTLQADVDRTHLSSQLQRDARGNVYGFRGGTFTLATVQLRVSVFRPDRVGPYGLVGAARGVSKPNVSETFPIPVTNDAAAVFLGGGIHVPLRDRVSLFSDVRFMLGAEGPEGIIAIAPLRAGLAWRF